ncbi:DUF2127 domain-containing protein [Xanthomonas massiliensis]|uniref:DUF2127 domain-containing protein n=1 Tax=Xanthomonas massiliensis TaxID=1720302 RepID=UPI003CCDBDE0
MGEEDAMAHEPPRPYNPSPRAHPGLHVLALVEGGKGLLAVLAASGLELIGPDPLRHALHYLISRLHLDPDHGALPSLLRVIDPSAVHLAAGMILLYGLLHLVEAWGLWRARAWASWLGCISASLYLPFDIFAIHHHPSWTSWAVLGFNLLLVAILGRDIHRRHARPANN